MLKRIISGFVCVAVLTAVVSGECSALSVSARSAVLMCESTGEVLYGKNADERLSMASTTKIMTALLLIEQKTPERVVTVTKEMTAVEGTSMGLLPGDSVTHMGLVSGMLLSSGNDAALTAAISVSGSQQEFARLMNERAAEIGMTATSFVTASGLDSKEHYSTARDMALLGCEAIRSPVFRSICSQKRIALEYGNPPYRRTLSNHNRLLDKYEHTIGIKTGFTKKSGRCLVSAAEKDGITLVAVTLNAPDDWNDHISMFEYGFSVLDRVPLETVEVSVPVTGGNRSSVKVRCAQEPTVVTGSDGTVGEIKKEIFLKPFEYAPIEEGQVLGKAVYKEDGKVIAEADLTADGSVEVKKTVIKEEIQTAENRSLFSKAAEKIKGFFNRWHMSL